MSSKVEESTTIAASGKASKGPSHRVINFYRQHDKWGEFSNFYAAPITMRGKVWPTTEHYFQAMKFVGTEHEEIVRQAPSPGQAAKKGRSRARPLRKDWERVKDQVMYDCCLVKFGENAKLKELLLSTGDAKLVEHTRNDRYWGDGGDGTGKNKLGITLMRVRDTLRAAEAGKTSTSADDE